jgi:hypothetical protein
MSDEFPHIKHFWNNSTCPGPCAAMLVDPLGCTGSSSWLVTMTPTPTKKNNHWLKLHINLVDHDQFSN